MGINSLAPPVDFGSLILHAAAADCGAALSG
jgi:hypothetical protein